MTHNNSNNKYINEYIKDLKIWQSEIKKRDSDIKKSKLDQAISTATPKPPIVIPSTTSTNNSTTTSTNNNNTATTPNIIDNTNESIKYKEKGNLLFGQQKYKESIEYYTLGIQLDSTNAVLYGNRAMAYLKLKNFNQAELDSTRCLNLDPTYLKCYHRRGLARIELKKYEEAIGDFKHILNNDPSNKDTQNELNKAIKLLKEQKEKEQKEQKEKEQQEKERLNNNSSNNISSNNNNIINNSNKNNNNNKPIKIQEINNNVNNKQTNKIETISEPIILKSTNSSTSQTSNISQSSSVDQTLETKPTAPISSTSKITPIVITSTKTEETTSSSSNNSTVNKPLSLSERLSKMSNIKAPVPKAPPKNSFDFERTYHSFKGDLSSLYQYFKLIDPNQIPRILDEALTPSLFTDIIKILENYYLVNKEYGLIFNILSNILKINRINLNIQFISKEEKQLLASIINSLYNNIDNSIEKSNIDNLLIKYTS